MLPHMPTILLIDDFDLAVETERDYFEASGFRVLTASSGREGLELLRREEVDAILTDYEMPEMTGLEIAAHAKQLKPSVPVVIYSGSAEKIDSPFVAAWLTKTTQMNDVRLKIEELISPATPATP
jgi:CheY-like chemotaxis protein